MAPTATSVRIGALVPNSGPLPLEVGIPAMAARLEAAGFESLWVSDHIVLPTSIESHYPFAADGRATWPSTTPYVDALIALALMAAATERATLGTAVLVLPLRHPVVFAKQAASIDVASGGRLQPRRGSGLAARGVRRTRRSVRGSRPPSRRVDGDRPRLLDGHPGRSLERALHAPCGRALPADARPADPVPDGRPLSRRTAPRRPAGGGLACPAVALRARSRRPRNRG